MAKREFKRSDMIRAGLHENFECMLCGGAGHEPTGILHHATCVFAQNCITGIKLDGVSGGIVFRQDGKRWWWTSPPASGAEYHIEKLPRCYAMFDEPGNSIHACVHLYSLRLWGGLNQGVL